MGKTFVKNGTPVGNEHLCKSCTWGQFTVGYRESDVLAFCTNTRPNFKVPFAVHECSEYADKQRPDWQQMEKLAIHIQPSRISKKTRGFNATEPKTPQEPEVVVGTEEEEEEATECVAAIDHELEMVFN